MRQKQQFSTIFLIFTIFLMFLPFLVTFNDVLTKGVEKLNWYMFLQDNLVPIEVRMIKTMLWPLGDKIVAHTSGFMVNGIYVGMTWNCIGWQSFLLLLITLAIGLKNGSYTLVSKIETIILGVLGTFVMNIFRLTIILSILIVSRPVFAVLYHDYLAAIFTMIWLFFFWWFAYKYVLEEKEVKALDKSQS